MRTRKILYARFLIVEISKKIRELRKKKNLSQEKLARLADVSYNTIVKIESGESVDREDKR